MQTAYLVGYNKDYSGWSTRKEGGHLMCSPVAEAHFCPFPPSQQGNLYQRFWDLGSLLSNFAKKKALEDLMDYSHANFQSFPLSHHKVTKARSQYRSVNS